MTTPQLISALSIPVEAAAAATVVILYWLMVEGRGRRDDRPSAEESSEAAARPFPASSSPHLRAAAFALLGGITVLLLVAGQEPATKTPAVRPPEDEARAFRSYSEGLLEAKRSFVPELIQAPRETAARLRTRAIRQYEAAVRAAPSVRMFRRQLGILYAFQGQREAARAQFRRLAELHRKTSGPRAEAEAGLWARLTGDAAVPASAVPELRRQIVARRLGWFEHLALATLYRRTGQQEPAEAAVRAASRQALRELFTLLLATLALFLLCFAGVIGGPVGLYLIGRGRIRRAPARFRVEPAVLYEAFILSLFIYALQAVPGLIEPLLRPSPAERGLAQTILLILASDALQLVSVGYLWMMLARRGLSLSEVGLHARELAANIRFGLGAYVVALPWVFAIGVLVDRISRAYFPDVAPPFHPLQALTAGTHDWWLRALLLVVAAVGAPFFEELFFRGVLYGALRRRFGVAVGVVVSAALFAALHPQLPLGFLPIFFLGAIFAAIYEWRQSLVPGMVFHGVHNGLLFLLMNLLFPPSG
jgi:membrane protease YdiL (CAAX protease family)